jgi:hypothetical protein
MLQGSKYNQGMTTMNEVPWVDNVCRVCRTRIAEKSTPFYCAKTSELRPGRVPIYSFSTPVCNVCIGEHTEQRKRKYWRGAFAVIAVVFISAFIATWKFLVGSPTETILRQIVGSLLMAAMVGVVSLVFALIFSTQACSRKIVAFQLAVKDGEAALKAAGFTGFWIIPPKQLTLR